MENIEFVFFVLFEVSGLKIFCLVFFKIEFINWFVWVRGKGGGCRKS